MKNVAVLTKDGEFALVFLPSPGGFDSSRVPTPGNLQNANARGSARVGGGGAGLGAGGINWCKNRSISFILKYETSFVWWLLYDDAISVVDIKRKRPELC